MDKIEVELSKHVIRCIQAEAEMRDLTFNQMVNKILEQFVKTGYFPEDIDPSHYDFVRDDINFDSMREASRSVYRD